MAAHRSISPVLIRVLDQTFVVAAHTAVVPDPDEGALDDPAAPDDAKVAGHRWWCLAWCDPYPPQAGPPMLADDQRLGQRLGQPGFQLLAGALLAQTRATWVNRGLRPASSSSAPPGRGCQLDARTP